ncbi:MAG: ATP-binding protein [Candidatus Omnitrophica bacterium]|nr:ATP-binding protein [Candidatus Omnitrophota bacterium]MDD5575158.1 ATP-binding protein [Candidatus Omnitrophota bacterium]
MEHLNFSKETPSDLSLVPQLLSDILQEIKKLPLGDKALHDIKLSLQEALVNAIKHGSRLNRALSVRLDVEARQDSLVMTVTDQGEGFDAARLMDPTQPANLQRLSGRGIFLIRNLMDGVEFFNGGRKIQMIKFFQKGANGENERRKKG